MAYAVADKALHRYFPFGFHLSRKASDWLDLLPLLQESWQLNRPESFVVRRLADRFNDRLAQGPSLAAPIRGGDLISVGTIVDVLRYVALVYCQDQRPGVIEQGLFHVRRQHDIATVDTPPHVFVHLYPPQPVLRGKIGEREYLNETTDGMRHHEYAVVEMVLLALAMENPAFRPFQVLFDDTELRHQSPYDQLVDSLEAFLNQQPAFMPLAVPLLECLRAPMRAAPNSLEGQLDYIRRNWGAFLPPDLIERLLLASDLLKEERAWRMLGEGGAPVLEFGGQDYRDERGYPEPAAFSIDADWMSNVVLIAKSTYVWLDQLSKKYRRRVRYLNEIPDEELDQLARWGFTGLWLIGVWERSPASAKIKQMMGNPEAASSAYSLYDYVIADDLGGEAAYDNLRERAWQRGIRLASDMVPNHVGIYSRWVVEHPQWFIQSAWPPFPVYSFTGENLSWESRVAIQIEDGYWTHRDAAVVFKRTDTWTGDVRYIYHGNDGTSMPWNDTAQLNFLLPEVREAVVQTILHVARKFPIIRFDAAMTLAKKHYQRLWFPLPGEGGAIPSRAEYSMTREEFDRIFPVEFWREVVDRVAAEVPDTLLLAEAFWLMEGYFVRTLGMHRVYNSAFMNMLKMEENSKYRQTVKNVLTFSPEVLKRFVNFMNNPDERTAVDQFGRGDKYFGVAVMMATMPGLPMFGHGQIEGFTERYGMEYRRAYWDEQIDYEMVRRHEEQIFPLMRRRYLFSGAENFAFFDFVVPDGWVDENVFAYSNRVGGDRAVIFYNNAYNTTNGRIHTSTEINAGKGDETFIVRRPLAEALGLNTDGQHYYLFRDYATGLEYVRNGKQIAEEGMWAKLYAYQYHAFLDWREVVDTDGGWGELNWRLSGNGVPNIDEAHRELLLEPILNPFKQTLRAAMREMQAAEEAGETVETAEIYVDNAAQEFVRVLQRFCDCNATVDSVAKRITRDIYAVAKLTAPGDDSMARYIRGLDGTFDERQHDVVRWALAGWAILRWVGEPHAAGDKSDLRGRTLNRIHEWRFVPAVERVLHETNDFQTAHDTAHLAWLVTAYDTLLVSSKSLVAGLDHLLGQGAARDFLRINEHEGTLWFNKEQFESLVAALAAAAKLRMQETAAPMEMLDQAIEANAHRLLNAAHLGGYRVDELLVQAEG